MKYLLTVLLSISILGLSAQNKVILKVSGGGSGSSSPTSWGTIPGTLSNQTDLQNALNLKMNISDTSGKWIGKGWLSTLQSSSGGSVGNLQTVTNNGATTTNQITTGSEVTNFVNFVPQTGFVGIPTTGNYWYDSSGMIMRSMNNQSIRLTKVLIPSNTNIVDSFPNESGTFMMIRDTSLLNLAARLAAINQNVNVAALVLDTATFQVRLNLINNNSVVASLVSDSLFQASQIAALQSGKLNISDTTNKFIGKGWLSTLQALSTGSGTISQVNDGWGITGGTITTTGTVAVDTSLVSTKNYAVNNSIINSKLNTSDTSGKWISSGFLPSLQSSSGGSSFSGVLDVNGLPVIRTAIPATGWGGSSDTVANNNWYNIDSLNQTIASRAYLGNGEFGGWLTSNESGGKVQLEVPYVMFFGDGVAASTGMITVGGIGDTSILDVGNLNRGNKNVSAEYWVNQLTNMPVINRGSVANGLFTTSGCRNRMARDVFGVNATMNDGKDAVGGVSSVLLHKPSFVIISAGLEDIIANVPIAITKSNLLWMAQQCAINNVHAIFLNIPSQGNGVLSRTQINEIDILNQWMPNALNMYGAVTIDINSFWNSGTYGGVSSYMNDNWHPSSYVNTQNRYFTPAGYDSIAQFIVRYGRLPVLTKMIFQSVLDPTYPPTNFDRPTSISLGGTSYTLPNNAIDTITLTAPLPTDTVSLVINGAINVRGTSGLASGFNAVYCFVDNNPTGQIYYTQKIPFRGDNTGDVQATSLTIKPNVYQYNVPIDITSPGNLGGNTNYTSHALRMVQYPGGNYIVFNGGTDTTNLSSCVFSVKNGSIGTDANFLAPSGTNSQFGQIRIVSGIAAPANFGIGVGYQNYGMQFNSYTSGQNPRAYTFGGQGQNMVNAGGARSAIVQIDSTIGMGNITTNNGVTSALLFSNMINNTNTTNTGNQIRGITYEPNIKSIGSARHLYTYAPIGANNFDSTSFGRGYDSSHIPTEVVDISGGVALTGSIKLATSQTTISGSTSGSGIFVMPHQGAAYRMVMMRSASLNGTATWTFPTAFTYTPSVTFTDSGLSVTSISTTSVTITGTGTTGIVKIEGQ